MFCISIILFTFVLIKFNFLLQLANHFAAWALFLAWIDLTTYLGRFGYIGEYVFIIFHITKVLFTCLLVYTPALFAFTFGFCMLLHSNATFESWTSGCFKVIAMMLGELEFGDTFVYHEVKDIGGRNISVQILFLLFVFLVAVIIMNLLVAMTVSATEELKKTSGIIQAEKKIKDIYKEGFVNQYAGGSSAGFFKSLLWKIQAKIPWKLLNEVHKYSTVKSLLHDKKSNKICLSKKKKQLKPPTLNPLTWHFLISIKNGWNGGDYPLYTYKFRKLRKVGFNANDHIVKQTKETVQKINERNEALSANAQAIRNDMNKQWRDLEREKNTIWGKTQLRVAQSHA